MATTSTWAFRTLAALAGVFLLRSAEAAWGRYEIPGTRYKFDLLGMQRITGLDGADTINDHCSWYGDHKEMSQCSVAPGASSSFRRVQLAPLMAALSATALLVAVAIDVTGRRRSAIVLASIVGAVAIFGALRLLTGNVGTAMRVYAGHSVEMNGSGLTAAWLVVFAFIAMGAISLVPAAWSGRRRRA